MMVVSATVIPTMATVVSVRFFFSSRRRHTSSLRDWSSDVCSSDLRTVALHLDVVPLAGRLGRVDERGRQVIDRPGGVVTLFDPVVDGHLDSVVADVLVLSRRERIGPHEDAAIAQGGDFEVALQLEVREFLVVYEHIGTAAVRIDRLVIDAPVAGFAVAPHPAVQTFAIEEQRPPGTLF